MKKVTINFDEEVARWARIRAAEEEQSMSRWVGEVLRDKMVSEQDYAAAKARFFSILPQPMRRPGERWPSRDELHDRDALRPEVAL